MSIVKVKSNIIHSKVRNENMVIFSFHIFHAVKGGGTGPRFSAFLPSTDQ
jgi:hypothetical protein